MPDEPRKPIPQSFLRGFALALDLPFVLVAGVVVGGGAGYLLDRWWHTGSLFTIILGFLGFAGGIWAVLRIVGRSGKKDG